MYFARVFIFYEYDLEPRHCNQSYALCNLERSHNLMELSASDRSSLTFFKIRPAAPVCFHA